MKQAAVVVLNGFLLAGCAAPVVKLPNESPVSITVMSSVGPSEFDSGEFLIPDSQVFFTTGRQAGHYAGALLGSGLVGYAIGSAVNAALNASDLGDDAPSLTMRFSGVVVEALKTQPAGQAATGPSIRIARADDPSAAIQLEPLARFMVLEKPNAHLMFVLNASFDAPGVRGKLSRISYLHIGYAARPLRDGGRGWADQGGAAFRATADKAFVRMTDVFKADLRGEIKREAANLKRVQWQTPDAKASRSGLLIYEQPDYVAVMPLLPNGEPVRNNTFVFERSHIRPE